MSDGTQPEIPGHRLDADAFCIVCSSVNPEGTLICRTCGNNLRDQKAQRVAGTLAIDANLLQPERTAWLPKALIVLGILIVLWTAFNLGNIEEWLVGARTAGGSGGQVFWDGSNSDILDEMSRELDANPLTKEEKDAAKETLEETLGAIPPAGSYEGRYLLLRAGGIPGEYGEALVRQVDDERVLFVARLNRGRAELRGEGYFRGASSIDALESAGLMINGRCFDAGGIATYAGDIWYTCYAQSTLNNDSYSAVAVRVK